MFHTESWSESLSSVWVKFESLFIFFLWNKTLKKCKYSYIYQYLYTIRSVYQIWSMSYANRVFNGRKHPICSQKTSHLLCCLQNKTICLYHVVHPPAACSHMVLTAAIFVTHLHKKTEGKYLLKVKKDTNLSTKTIKNHIKSFFFYSLNKLEYWYIFYHNNLHMWPSLLSCSLQKIYNFSNLLNFGHLKPKKCQTPNLTQMSQLCL